LIPGENDSPKEIDEMTRWVADKLGPEVPMHFTAFHPSWKMLNHASTSLKTLQMARKIALDNGIRYVYTGNVHDETGATTYCHQCGNPLVGRDWYKLTQWNLTDDGKCAKCGAVCAGRFDGPPEGRGSGRHSVRLGSD
jgi:pyruvate formate lyase activating enzyme